MKLLRREIWKPIPDFPGYEVSNQGRVRSFWGKGPGCSILNEPQRILKPGIDLDGYHMVSLRKNKITFTKKVHRLVLENFIGSCPSGHVGRHADDNPGNNRIANLSWSTQKDNCSDKIRNGTSLKGEKNPSSKLSNIQVKEIKDKLAKRFTHKTLGKEYGVSSTTIWQISNKKKWLGLV